MYTSHQFEEKFKETGSIINVQKEHNAIIVFVGNPFLFSSKANCRELK